MLRELPALSSRPALLGGVWLAGASVRKFSMRKPTCIGFRAAPWGGRCRDVLWLPQLKGWLYLAISGRQREMEGRGRGGRVIPLPQVRGSTGERSHYEERWALSVPCPASLVLSPSNLFREICAFAYEWEHGCNSLCCICFVRTGCRVSSPLSCCESVLLLFSLYLFIFCLVLDVNLLHFLVASWKSVI